MAFLLCFFTSIISDLEKNLASRPQEDGYFEALACHLFGLLAPQLKFLPCLNTLSLGFIGLSCDEQSKLGLGNRGFQYLRNSSKILCVLLMGK